MVEKEFKVICRGVRGSRTVCNKDVLHFGGETSCYELHINGETIFLDLGSGAADAGSEIVGAYFKSGMKTRPHIWVFLSHFHYDHILGVPFFPPIYVGNFSLTLFGPCAPGYTFEKKFNEIMSDPFFPVEMRELNSIRTFCDITCDRDAFIISPGNDTPEQFNRFREKPPVHENDIVVTCMRSYGHPREGNLIFKIEANGKTLVHATDTEGYVTGDNKLAAFAKNADLMFFDSQYTLEEYAGMPSKQGYGHSTYQMAIDVAKAAGVKQLGLIHHDPLHSDKVVKKIERAAKKKFPNSFAAYQGQIIEL